ncbi:hypothetical protein ACFQ1S_38425, partial [Kibdelosporangium lantanae]
VAQGIGVPVDSPYVVAVVDGTSPTLECPLATIGVTSVWQVHGHTVVGLIATPETTLPEVLKALRDNATTPAGISMAVQGLSQVDPRMSDHEASSDGESDENGTSLIAAAP